MSRDDPPPFVVSEDSLIGLRPEHVGAEETARFLAAALPPPPVRVLEVGAGRGEVAKRLLAHGHDVVALDRDPASVAAARALGVRVVEADFLTWEGDSFEAVAFTRCLHHLHPLERAVERARDRLAPGGLLLAEEFAWERMDAPTAAWHFELERTFSEAGLLVRDEAEPNAARSRGGRANDAKPVRRPAPAKIDPLAVWRAHHEREHQVHTGTAMLEALESRFDVLAVDPAPYVYRYLAARLEPTDRGGKVAFQVLQQEEDRIERGRLAAVGLRVVARAR